MKAIVYVFGLVFAVIAAPFVGLAIGGYTFFVCFYSFIQGCHQAMMNNLYDETPQNLEEKEAEPQDIWEKHIKRMSDKRD
jgi:hypothetical protein